MTGAPAAASGGRAAADGSPGTLREAEEPELLCPVEFGAKATRAIAYPPPATRTTTAAVAARRGVSRHRDLEGLARRPAAPLPARCLARSPGAGAPAGGAVPAGGAEPGG